MKTNNGYVSYTIPANNMLALCILEILRNYSDSTHRLSQKEILLLLEKDFSLRPHRTSVKSNLMSLIDFGYDIKYRETQRGDSVICNGWYLEKAFTETELNIICESLRSAKKISPEECTKLAEKIRRALYRSTT